MVKGCATDHKHYVTVTVRRVNKDILLCLLRPKDLCYLRLEARKKYV